MRNSNSQELMYALRKTTKTTKPKKRCPDCGKTFSNLPSHRKNCKGTVNIGE